MQSLSLNRLTPLWWLGNLSHKLYPVNIDIKIQNRSCRVVLTTFWRNKCYPEKYQQVHDCEILSSATEWNIIKCTLWKISKCYTVRDQLVLHRDKSAYAAVWNIGKCYAVKYHRVLHCEISASAELRKIIKCDRFFRNERTCEDTDRCCIRLHMRWILTTATSQDSNGHEERCWLLLDLRITFLSSKRSCCSLCLMLESSCALNDDTSSWRSASAQYSLCKRCIP